MKRLVWGLALLSILLGSCSRPGKLEVGDDIAGTQVVVWDILEPEFPDAPSYKEGVSRTISRFQDETGVTVHLRYVERKDVAALLLGNLPPGTERPHLVSSSEWPMVPSDPILVPDAPESSPYLEIARLYWCEGGAVSAIPAYIHWFGEAVKEGRVDEEGAKGGVGEKDRKGMEGSESEVGREDGVGTEGVDGWEITKLATGYWVESPGFLRSVFVRSVFVGPDAKISEESVLQYALWVKETYGELKEDVLQSWDRGEIDSLVPVTPHLYRWLQPTAEVQIALRPVRSPFGDAALHYTVPAYHVLAEDGKERLAALELGAQLARHLGLWAARALGCVPALSSDSVVFHLESGLRPRVKDLVWEAAMGGDLRAPSVEEYLAESELHSALIPILQRYFSGDGGREALEEGIRSLFRGNARP